MIMPVGMSASDWCNQMTLDLCPYGVLPLVMSDEQWRPWASQVITLPGLASLAPPSHEDFEDWERWAYAFISSINSVL